MPGGMCRRGGAKLAVQADGVHIVASDGVDDLPQKRLPSQLGCLTILLMLH
jgi:hypothetical protein